MDTHQRPEALSQIIPALRQVLGDRLATSLALREQHGRDQSWAQPHLPDAVAFVESTQEVSRLLSICAGAMCPVIPYGAGTSLEGQVTAPQGGLSLDMTRMNRVLDINTNDLDARVEAGVTRKSLNSLLRDQGLFFPIDPGADATLGGMAATRASGTNAVRYGTMRDAVLGLTAVMADGTVVRTGTRARKSSAGYDLTRLLVGSEGTLGVITEVQVRLNGIPEQIIAGVASFPNVEEVCEAVIETIQLGLPIARIELVDDVSIRAINAYSKLDLEETPTLFLEFHGSRLHAEEQVENFREIALGHGAAGFRWATQEEERQRLWQARHDAFWAARALARPGQHVFSTDVCVPISSIARCVAETRADLAREGMAGPMIGHVGDGNFHTLIYCDPGNAQELTKAKGFYRRLVERALSMGGTITGEHGVGTGKIDFLELEHGPAINLMRQIKKALDPLNIMNPGKIFRL